MIEDGYRILNISRMANSGKVIWENDTLTIKMKELIYNDRIVINL